MLPASVSGGRCVTQVSREVFATGNSTVRMIELVMKNSRVSETSSSYVVYAKTLIAEHVWEKHFIKTFLNWLSYDSGEGHGAITDCAGKKSIFNTLSTTANSQFNRWTPAQALANAITCYGGNCPDNNRVSEFLILEAGVNGMKTRVRISVVRSSKSY